MPVTPKPHWILNDEKTAAWISFGGFRLGANLRVGKYYAASVTITDSDGNVFVDKAFQDDPSLTTLKGRARAAARAFVEKLRMDVTRIP